jgi:hypothetical protein
MAIFTANLNFSHILSQLLSLLYIILLLTLILTVIYFSVWLAIKSRSFNHSVYKAASGNGFFKTFFNKGNYGEFLIYKTLEKIKINKKLVTNLYIPLKNGNTTEIDLVMICTYGIFVIESKNYSGWIFGNDNNSTWTQTLQNGQKNKFYNPIMQNKTHMNALKRLLALDLDLFYSYIVFSERCNLKNVKSAESNVVVLKANALYKKINSKIKALDQKFTDKQVDDLYVKLSFYANAGNEIKQNHILNIKNKLKT